MEDSSGQKGELADLGEGLAVWHYEKRVTDE